MPLFSDTVGSVSSLDSSRALSVLSASLCSSVFTLMMRRLAVLVVADFVETYKYSGTAMQQTSSPVVTPLAMSKVDDVFNDESVSPMCRKAHPEGSDQHKR